MSEPLPTANAAQTDPLRPFTPRRGRVVGLGSALGCVLVFGGLAALMPGTGHGGSWGPGDRAACAALGLVLAAFLVRYARIEAVPDRESLRVRNLFVTRVLPWHEIESVHLDDGEPWVTLGLRGHETLACMAIQRADGSAQAQAEAMRLASLAEALGPRRG